MNKWKTICINKHRVTTKCQRNQYFSRLIVTEEFLGEMSALKNKFLAQNWRRNDWYSQCWMRCSNLLSEYTQSWILKNNAPNIRQNKRIPPACTKCMVHWWNYIWQSLEKHQILLLTNRCHLVTWIFTLYSIVVDSSGRHLACFRVMQMRHLHQILDRAGWFLLR